MKCGLFIFQFLEEVKLDEKMGNDLAGGSKSSASKTKPGRSKAKSEKSKFKPEKEVRWLAFAQSESESKASLTAMVSKKKGDQSMQKTTTDFSPPSN